MRVEIKNDLLGLEALRGAVVIIDVFRASNTTIGLLGAGAGEVVLVADLGQAYGLKAANPDWLLFGERKGLAQPGFDGGNSPTEAEALGKSGKMAGRTVVLTTSAGTQAVHRLTGAGEVFFGSFANAGAIVKAIKKIDPPAAYLLPMGYEARRPAEEDDLAAMYLFKALTGERPDFGPIRERLLASASADRLRRRGQAADLDFCARLDHRPLVPAVRYTAPPRAGIWGGTA